MATYADRYEFWVAEAERWDAKKKAREAAIKREILGERNRVKVLGGVDTAKIRVDSAIVNDPDVHDAEKMRQRAVDRATMYGMGMLVEHFQTLR